MTDIPFEKCPECKDHDTRIEANKETLKRYDTIHSTLFKRVDELKTLIIRFFWGIIASIIGVSIIQVIANIIITNVGGP